MYPDVGYSQIFHSGYSWISIPMPIHQVLCIRMTQYMYKRDREVHTIYLTPKFSATPCLYWFHGDNTHETWLIHQPQLSFRRLPVISQTLNTLTCLLHRRPTTQVYWTPIFRIGRQPTRLWCTHLLQGRGNSPSPLSALLLSTSTRNPCGVYLRVVVRWWVLI